MADSSDSPAEDQPIVKRRNYAKKAGTRVDSDSGSDSGGGSDVEAEPSSATDTNDGIPIPVPKVAANATPEAPLKRGRPPKAGGQAPTALPTAPKVGPTAKPVPVPVLVPTKPKAIIEGASAALVQKNRGWGEKKVAELTTLMSHDFDLGVTYNWKGYAEAMGYQADYLKIKGKDIADMQRMWKRDEAKSNGVDGNVSVRNKKGTSGDRPLKVVELSDDESGEDRMDVDSPSDNGDVESGSENKAPKKKASAVKKRKSPEPKVVNAEPKAKKAAPPVPIPKPASAKGAASSPLKKQKNQDADDKDVEDLESPPSFVKKATVPPPRPPAPAGAAPKKTPAPADADKVRSAKVKKALRKLTEIQKDLEKQVQLVGDTITELRELDE